MVAVTLPERLLVRSPGRGCLSPERRQRMDIASTSKQRNMILCVMACIGRLDFDEDSLRVQQHSPLKLPAPSGGRVNVEDAGTGCSLQRVSTRGE